MAALTMCQLANTGATTCGLANTFDLYPNNLVNFNAQIMVNQTCVYKIFKQGNLTSGSSNSLIFKQDSGLNSSSYRTEAYMIEYINTT